jgi:hypothetical protein
MKVLVLATISFASVVGLAEAAAADPMVPSSPPPLATHVKVFTVAPKAGDKFACDAGSIQSLSAVHVADEKNVPVVFLNQGTDIPSDTWSSANGFRFEQTPSEKVRVTLICGG